MLRHMRADISNLRCGYLRSADQRDIVEVSKRDLSISLGQVPSSGGTISMLVPGRLQTLACTEVQAVDPILPSPSRDCRQKDMYRSNYMYL